MPAWLALVREANGVVRGLFGAGRGRLVAGRRIRGAGTARVIFTADGESVTVSPSTSMALPCSA